MLVCWCGFLWSSSWLLHWTTVTRSSDWYMELSSTTLFLFGVWCSTLREQAPHHAYLANYEKMSAAFDKAAASFRWIRKALSQILFFADRNTITIKRWTLCLDKQRVRQRNMLVVWCQNVQLPSRTRHQTTMGGTRVKYELTLQFREYVLNERLYEYVSLNQRRFVVTLNVWVYADHCDAKQSHFLNEPHIIMSDCCCW